MHLIRALLIIVFVCYWFVCDVIGWCIGWQLTACWVFQYILNGGPYFIPHNMLARDGNSKSPELLVLVHVE